MHSLKTAVKSLSRTCNSLNTKRRYSIPLAKIGRLDPDLFVAGIAQLAIQVGSAAFLFLSASGLSAENFGSYQVGRRVFPLIGFPALVGTGLSVPRLVAMAVGEEQKNRIHILLAAISIVFPILALLALPIFLFPRQVGQLVFGGSTTPMLTAGLLVCVVGLCTYTLIYGYLRGLRSLFAASVLAVLSMVVVPFAALILCNKDPGLLLLYGGLGWLAVSGACASYLFSGYSRQSLKIDRRIVSEMLVYGIPRLPGEFAQFGLSAVPVLIVSHVHGMQDAGFLSFAISVMMLASSMFDFLNIYLLPQLSALAAEQRWKDIRRLVKKSILVVIAGTALVGLMGWLLIGYIVTLLLDPVYYQAVPYARLLLLGVLPYSLFKTLRTALDAIWRFPYGSLSLIIGLTAISFVMILFPHVNPAVVMVCGLVMIGAIQVVACGYVFSRRLAA